MNEHHMTLGSDYSGQNLSGWFLSEKMDGCRAYWDGALLWTRGGNVIPAPAWFTEDLPASHLDCELWAGYGQREAARLATQYGRFTPACRLLIHDCPTATGNWAERIQTASATRYAFPVSFTVCRGHVDMLAKLRSVLGHGGEGMVARNPAVTRYTAGRTRNLLKIKPEFVQ
jgi:DNA ligase-1